MKYLIFSDLHGSSRSIKFILDEFNKQKCDKLICLGDVLYHGPRNDLPEFYNPKDVISLLNPYADKIICINGNCDAEVDQMVLAFKLNRELDLTLNGKECHLEHGHHLEILENSYDVILSGHTHIAKIEKICNTLYLNPGSITIPKSNTKNSYMIWEDNEIRLVDMNNNIIDKYLF